MISTLMLALTISSGNISVPKGKIFMLDNFWHGGVQGTVKGILTPEGDKFYQFSVRFNKKGRYTLEIVKFSEDGIVVMDSLVVDAAAGESASYSWWLPGREARNLLGDKPCVVLFRVVGSNGIGTSYMVLLWPGTGRGAKKKPDILNQKSIGN